MPYTIDPIAFPNALAIPERRWASAQQIQFTPFTSCIGLIGINGPNLTALHLGLVDGAFGFDNAAADQAAAIMAPCAAGIFVIGETAYWTNTVPGPYQHLLNQLNAPNLYPLADGTYGADLVGGVIQLTFQ
jgi:hypothetical protein